MKRKRIIIPVLVVAVAGVALAVWLSWRAENRAISVTGTGQVVRRSIEASVSANGTLVARQTRDVYVETPVRVLDILADRDKSVRRGDPVLAVDLVDLETQLEQAVLNRDSAELTLKRVRDIAPVANAEALQLAVRQAEAVLANDRSSLARAQADLAKNQPLHASGALSDSEYQRYERTVQDAQARVGLSEISVSTAKANLANNQTGTRKTDDQRALDIASQENLLKLQDLNVRTLQDRIARIRSAIASPIDGVVTIMNAVEGGTLSAVQPAYQVSDLTVLEVEAQVKEVEIRRIRVGQAVELTGDGIDEAIKVSGIVSAVATTAQIQRNSTGEETVVPVTVTIDAPPEGLRPGLTVTARIITDTRNDVPVIRYAMLTETEDGTSAVFVVQGETAVLTPIETGITSDLDIEVTQGLSGDETVILNPPQDLADGARIRVGADTGGGPFGGMSR